MRLDSVIHSLRGRVLLSAAMAVALGALTLAQATPALAAPRVFIGISVGCSVTNGASTLKVGATAIPTGGANIASVSVDIDPQASNDAPEAVDVSAPFNPSVTYPAAPGTYNITIIAISSNAPTVTRIGVATITGNRCSVRTT